MWYHKETRRPVAFEDIERMEAIPNWQELFEYLYPNREWQHNNKKQILIFGQADLEKLLTTDIRPYTTLQGYLEGKAMTEAQECYENVPHVVNLQAGLDWEVEANKHMMVYRQYFTVYYSTPHADLKTEPFDLSTLEAPATPTPKASSAPTGGPSTSRSVRRSARMMKAGRSAAKHAR